MEKENIESALSCDGQTAERILWCYKAARKIDSGATLTAVNNLVSVVSGKRDVVFYFVNKGGNVTVKFKTRERAERFANMTDAVLQARIHEVCGRGSERVLPMSYGKKTFKVNMGKYEFVSLLADGIDPLTGEKVFSPNTNLRLALKNLGVFVLRYEKIGTSKFRITTSEDEIKAQEEKILEQKRAKQVVKDNVGSVWTAEEDDRLIKEYYASVSIEEMMENHGRTRSAIERRILKVIPIDKIRK